MAGKRRGSGLPAAPPKRRRARVIATPVQPEEIAADDTQPEEIAADDAQPEQIATDDAKSLVQPEEWFNRQIATDLWLPGMGDLVAVSKPLHPRGDRRSRPARRMRRARIKQVHAGCRRRRSRQPAERSKHAASWERPRLPETQLVVEKLMTSWYDVTSFANMERLTPWRTASMSASAAEARHVPQRLRVVGGLGINPNHTKDKKLKRGKARKEPINSVIKLWLYPTTEQRQHLEQMFATNRAIYNLLVARSANDCATRLVLRGSDNTTTKMTIEDLSFKYRPIANKRSVSRYCRNKRALRHHLRVHSEVFDSAFRDFLKAIRSSLALFFVLRRKGKPTTFPKLKFKSKFARSNSIELRSTSLHVVHREDGEKNRVQFHPEFFGFGPNNGIEIREELPVLEHSVRLQRLREGEYYIAVPRFVEFVQTQSSRVCAIDPGVRNFATVYDPDGLTLSIKDSHAVLKRRFDVIAKAQSQLDLMTNTSKDKHSTKLRQRVKANMARAGEIKHKTAECMTLIGGDAVAGGGVLAVDGDGAVANVCGATPSSAAQDNRARYPAKSKEHRQRYRLRRQLHYSNRKVTRMVTDMHEKLSSWLAANYSQVLLPTFQSSKMVRKYELLATADDTPDTTPPEDGQGRRKRKIRSPTARAMLALAHYRFKMLLKYKMQRAGGRLIECTEEYTSKTCSRCGEIKDDLGGSRIYSCSHCQFVHDRDVNAAKNILHMNMQMLG